MKAGTPKPMAPLALSARARKALEALARGRSPIDVGGLADAILAAGTRRRDFGL